MSNQSQGSGTNERPLFQGLDEQERIYTPQQVPEDAPQQVPQANLPASEVDQDTAAIQATGSASVGADIDRDVILDTQGEDGSVVVPSQTWPGGSTNMPVPPIGAPGVVAEPSEEQSRRRGE